MLPVSSFKKNVDSLIAAAIGFFIIFLFTGHGGIGISPDAVVYSTTAENLHANGKLEDYGQDALVDFPAFYPIFLNALMLLTGLKPLSFAPYLNALLFAVVIYLSGYVMEQFLFLPKWYKIAILSCIVLSPALLEDYSMLWSETLFILLLLLFMIALHRYFESYSRKALIVAAVIASLASITRYAGVTIIATGGLLLLLDMKRPLRQKLTGLVLFSVISPLPLIINLACNYAFSGTMTGEREKSIVTLSKNIQNVGSVFCDWLPFLRTHHAAEIWVAVLFIAVPAFLCMKQLRRHGRIASFENISAAFSLIYVLFMILIATISRFETLNSRFMSPAFIPLLWSSSSWIFRQSQESSKLAKKWLVISGTIIFLSFQYNQLTVDSYRLKQVKAGGIPGYTEDRWRYSKTVLFIQKDSLPFKKDHSIYSDADDAVYFFTGRAVICLPRKDSPEELQEFLNDPHCYLVWFTKGVDTDLLDLNFVTGVKKMKLIKQFNDGAIYEFDK